MQKNKVSFLVFYLMWARIRKWTVPDVHVRAILWFEQSGQLAVLRCFRGFGKSTMLEIWNAYRFYLNPQFRILNQSADDKTAFKTSRGTQNVIRRHPLTRHLIRKHSVSVEQWWIDGAEENDPRNASFYAKGILSNVTSSRADEAQNDDVEVPKNTATADAREKLRERLGEQTHILVPGGRKLFIGTPHTHDSIYEEQEAMGADCLTIRLFEREYRIEDASLTEYELPFKPEYVFSGIGKNARVFRYGYDYTTKESSICFVRPPGGLVDFYAGSAWPERFNDKELERRRRETRTINEWDSQYQLHSKPVGEIRLDPEHMKAYDLHPRLEHANKHVRMILGNAQLVSGRAYWDPAEGNVTSNESTFSVLYDDAIGNHYWHVSEELSGEYAVFADTRNTKIIDGQVVQICRLIEKHNVLHVYVETNGVGSFTDRLLRRAIKESGLSCGVTAVKRSENKNRLILSSIEGPMKSGVLWAHTDVINGPAWDQMKDWKPAIKEQPDGHLDALAGALMHAPIRISKMVNNSTGKESHNWRENSGVFEATFER